MEPFNESGHKIQGHIYIKMMDYSRHISSIGYKEAREKPNLFYHPIELVCFFYDMRFSKNNMKNGHLIPSFWIKHPNKMRMWRRRRYMKSEMKLLDMKGCPYNADYSHPINIYDDFCYRWLESYTCYRWCEYCEDGYCKECGKDFQGPGPFCSKSCNWKSRKKYYNQKFHSILQGDKCEICSYLLSEDAHKYKKEISQYLGKRLLVGKKIIHHISYSPEKTMVVCQKCHNKIHHSKKGDLSEYLPIDKRPEKKAPLLIQCIRCDRKTRDRHTRICHKCKEKIQCFSCGKWIKTTERGFINICKDCLQKRREKFKGR